MRYGINQYLFESWVEGKYKFGGFKGILNDSSSWRISKHKEGGEGAIVMNYEIISYRVAKWDWLE